MFQILVFGVCYPLAFGNVNIGEKYIWFKSYFIPRCSSAVRVRECFGRQVFGLLLSSAAVPAMLRTKRGVTLHSPKNKKFLGMFVDRYSLSMASTARLAISGR